jgi:hypothetical protein
MHARGRFSFGVAFVAIGVAAWSWLLWAYEPVGRSAAHLPATTDGPLDFGTWLTSGRDLRLSALVLGVGGLLITARSWRPGAWLALALGAAWAAADFGLDVADVESVATVVVAGLVVAAAAAAILVAATRRREATGAGRTGWLLGYAGMAIGVETVGYVVAGSSPPMANVLLFAVVVASALVAGATVNPDGTPIVGWRPATVLVVLAIALYLPSYFGWWNSNYGSTGRPAFWWREAAELTILLLLAPLATAAVALTGAFSRRRVAVAVPAVVLALTPATFAQYFPPVSWLVPLVGQAPSFDATDGHRVLPGQLIGGAILGVSVWVLARLVPRFFGPAGPDTPTPAPVSARRWAAAVGLVLATTGVVSWAVAVAVVAPIARAVDHGQPISIYITASLIGWSANLRWGAILLAWGGVLLAARTRGRALPLALAVLGWFAADIVLTTIGVQGWLSAAICAVVVAVGLGTVALTGPPVAGVAPGSIIHAAAAAGAGIHLMAINGWMPLYLPSWIFQLGLAVTVLLVGAAVVHTLTSAGAARAGRLLGALVVAAAGLSGAVVHYLTARVGSERGLADWLLLTLVAATAVAATACALSAAGRIRGLWWAATGAVVLVVIGALPLWVAAFFIGSLAQDVAFGLGGLLGLSGEWSNDTVTGAVLGVSVALVALWPTALSTPDSPLATPATPPPPPPDRPTARAPVAVPGVPEVLTWPADPERAPV